MIIDVTFKDPDVVGDAIDDALKSSRPNGLTDAEWDAVKDVRRQEIGEKVAKWFEFDEYVHIRIDTDKDTADVVKK